jgi:trans-2,3-dihydro-3-hydroxyanthranilate isomerase
MQKVAREMNLSETAFVLPPSSKGSDVRLRYFTPTMEVPFCGHATVGTLCQLAKLNMYGLGGPGNNPVRVETNIGVLDMAVSNDKGKAPNISFVAPPLAMEKYSLQGAAFAEALGIPKEIIDPKADIYIDRQLIYLYAPIISIKALGDLSFDFTRIRKNFGRENIDVFCLYTKETVQKDSDLHARSLAPLVGIDEDPFTGSMQSGLIHAAKASGYLPKDQADTATEQGNFIGRPGFAKVHHDVKSDKVTVAANAVPVFSTKLELV